MEQPDDKTFLFRVPSNELTLERIKRHQKWAKANGFETFGYYYKRNLGAYMTIGVDENIENGITL